MCPKYRPASTYSAGVEGDADAATGSALDPTRRQGLDRAPEQGTIQSNNVGLPLDLDEVEATGNRDLRVEDIYSLWFFNTSSLCCMFISDLIN